MGYGKVGAAVLAMAALVSACGGGGGSRPEPQTATLSGIAATGAPFADATVTVYDRDGQKVDDDKARADGSFTLEVPVGTRAPLVIEAVREDTTLVSMFPETRTTRVNVTPLTNLMAALIAPDGNPLTLRTAAAEASRPAVQAALADVVALLQTLRTTIGDAADPLTGTFTANGTGHDRVLDALSITIRPTGTYSNIEVAVKGTSDDLVTNFSSKDTTLDPLPAVPADALPPVGIADLLEALAARMSACYAVPLEQRVSGATSSSTNVTGTAASVIAPACRTLFVNDDPASYLNNGIRVGRDAANNGAFTGFFRRGATGAVFDSTQLEFLRDNATRDVVFSYRVRGTDGSVQYDTLVARRVGDVLKLVGNQYVYNARVRPWFQDREFLNQAAASYVSTGYNIWIANQIEANAPLFSKVEVTAPDGSKLTFVPQAGRSELTALKADGTQSNSSVLVLAARFRDPATTGNPATLETGFRFATPMYTEAQLTAIPEQGTWALEFFHADTSRANVVQRYRTLSRASTLEEGVLVPMADLTPAAKTELRAATQQFGVVVFPAPSATNPNVARLATASGGDFWTVPTGATPPSTVSVYGRAPDPDGSGPLRGANFDDRVNVAPSDRKTTITCTTLSAGDVHCDSSTGVTQFAQNSTISVLELFAVGRRSVEYSKIPAFYYLLPR